MEGLGNVEEKEADRGERVMLEGTREEVMQGIKVQDTESSSSEEIARCDGLGVGGLFADDLFEEAVVRTRLTRQEKRAERRHGLIRVKHSLRSNKETYI